MTPRRLVLVGLLGCAVAACSADASVGDVGGDVRASADGNHPEREMSDGGTGARSDDASADAVRAPTLPPVRFVIRFDYRFDTKGFFAAPERKKALEGAARIWGRLLTDDFAQIPKGTYVAVRDPEHPAEPAQGFAIDSDIDDVVIFVGSSALAGSTTGTSRATAGLSGIEDDALRTSLDARFHGTPFQPWTGWISFDDDQPWYFDADPDVPKTIPAASLDFVSVALHEIGHVLGFGTADAFAKLSTTGGFDGPKARAAAGGKAPALTSDRSHFASSVLANGKRPLMDVSDAAGTRYLPTAIDIAVLEDLGFHF